ncbi:hypothetical protein EN958_14060, partial [Mesorhizobium sp. M7A.F.Ca.CA.002.15.1.1]
MSGKPRGLVLRISFAACCAAIPLVVCLASSPAYALSEIKREELPPTVTPPADDMSPPGSTVPMPNPVGTPPPSSQPTAPAEAEPDSPADGGVTRP